MVAEDRVLAGTRDKDAVGLAIRIALRVPLPLRILLPLWILMTPPFSVLKERKCKGLIEKGKTESKGNLEIRP